MCEHRRTTSVCHPQTCRFDANGDATRSCRAWAHCPCPCKSSRCWTWGGWASRSCYQTGLSLESCRPLSHRTNSWSTRLGQAYRRGLPPRASPSKTNCCNQRAHHCAGWQWSIGVHGAACQKRPHRVARWPQTGLLKLGTACYRNRSRCDEFRWTYRLRSL